MMMMNNNMAGLIVNAMRQGKTPRALVGELIGRDPRAQMAAQMMDGKNSAEMETLVRNMARERGIDLNDLARSIGVQIPSAR